MARLGKSKKELAEEETIEERDDSEIVSAYSKEGELRKKEAEEAGKLRPWEKVLIALGYVLVFIAAVVVVYFLQSGGE